MAPPTKSVREDTVVTDIGAELFVKTLGSGPPVFLLHGNFVSARMWDPQLAPLAERCTVVAYDLRGFGRSPVAGGRSTGWDDLDSLMRALGHESGHVVGLSMGGSVAIEFALTYPERVRSLVVVPGGISGSPDAQWMIEGFGAVQAARGARDFVRARDRIMEFPPMKPLDLRPSVRREVVEMLDEHRWNDSWEGVEPPDLDPPSYARLEDVAAPTLIISGALDDPSFLELGEEMERRMPRAERVVIPGAGHMVNMEAPDEFTAAVLEFLARHEPV